MKIGSATMNKTETFSSQNLGWSFAGPTHKEPLSSDSFAQSGIGSSGKLERKFEFMR